VAKFGQNWQKLSDFQTFSTIFQVVEHAKDSFERIQLKNETFSKKSKNSIFGQFLPILDTFYELKITF
jgi:hypothetical protein